MAKVTVIIPAYQAESTLERAIASVTAQTMGDFSLWVVDDGSPDRTFTIADQARQRDKRIHAFRFEQNQGASVAMNYAWQNTDSEFVAILDADDLSVPDRLRLQVEALGQHPELSVLGGAAHFVDERGGFMRTVYLPTHHRDLRRARWYRSPFVHPTVMMRRSFLERTGGYTPGLRLGEDYDHWMRGFMYPEVRYGNLNVPLVHYRAKAVQRWEMIKASARVRRLAGEREGRTMRSLLAAGRILAEGVVEQTGVFASGTQRGPAINVPGQAGAGSKP